MQISIAQLGWIIADAVGGAIDGIVDFFRDALGDMLDTILSILLTALSGIFYGLQMGFFVIMDVIQTLFRKVAGLDSYYYQGNLQTGDMAMDFIFNPTVMAVFWSVLVVAGILLFATTFVAIIRSEITEKGSNPKAPIIGRALKSILYFAMVPIVSILGIFFANVLLKTLDRATTVNNVTTLSGMVFQAAAAQACRAENSVEFANKFKDDFGVSIGTITDKSQTHLVADAANKAFANGTVIKMQSVTGDEPYMWADYNILGGSFDPTADVACSISEFHMVFYYYNLMPGMGFDYLIGYIGGFIACAMLLTSILGCMQRLFEITILFVISPPIIALMPIDNGSRYNTWRQEFVKRVLACYGPIIGLNLVFMLLTIIGDYSLFPNETGYAIHNALVKMFFMIVALLCLKDITGLVSSLSGGGDVSAMGEGKKEGTQKMAGQILSAGQRLGHAAVNPFRRTVKDGYTKKDGKYYDDNGEEVSKGEATHHGFGRAMHGLSEFRKDAHNHGLGGAVGGLLNKRDGLINDMLDITGVGKSLRDKAVGENPNSIGATLLGQGNRDRVKAAADAKAKKDAEEDAQTRYAVTEGAARSREAETRRNNAMAQLTDRAAELDRMLAAGEISNSDYNRETLRNAQMMQDINEGKIDPSVAGGGGTSDVFGVANNVQDIENRLNDILKTLRDGIKVKPEGGSGSGAGTITSEVADALKSAAENINLSVAGFDAVVTRQGAINEKLAEAGRNINSAAKGIKPETYHSYTARDVREGKVK